MDGEIEMSAVSRLAKENGVYLGYFIVEEERMPFIPALPRKDIISMGDVVYFMFVQDELMKIGKATGKGGFPGRAAKYQTGRGKNGDNTNRLIMNVMESISQERIDVYAISVPRQKIQYECPLTFDIITTEIPMNQDVELRLTTEYLNESTGKGLPFCRQLK